MAGSSSRLRPLRRSAAVHREPGESETIGRRLTNWTAPPIQFATWKGSGRRTLLYVAWVLASNLAASLVSHSSRLILSSIELEEKHASRRTAVVAGQRKLAYSQKGTTEPGWFIWKGIPMSVISAPLDWVELASDLRLPPKTDRRLQELMDRNTEGRLSAEESADLESLVELSETLSLVRTEALHLLGRVPK